MEILKKLPPCLSRDIVEKYIPKCHFCGLYTSDTETCIFPIDIPIHTITTCTKCVAFPEREFNPLEETLFEYMGFDNVQIVKYDRAREKNVHPHKLSLKNNIVRLVYVAIKYALTKNPVVEYYMYCGHAYSKWYMHIQLDMGNGDFYNAIIPKDNIVYIW